LRYIQCLIVASVVLILSIGYIGSVCQSPAKEYKGAVILPHIAMTETADAPAIEMDIIGGKQTNFFPLTPDERILVERVVAAEARGEKPAVEAQMAIAQVVIDRASEWGMTPTEVVSAPGQFAAPYQGEISADTVEAVSRVFDSGERIYSESTTKFYAYKLCTPYWAAGRECRGTIGGHRFME